MAHDAVLDGTPDSSPASVTPAAPAAPVTSSGDVLAEMTSDQRHHWRTTGELPAPRSDADSTPAEPVAQAASTDAPAVPEAASEPAAPAKKNAETRIQELLAERKALQQQLEEARRASAPPSPAPGPDAPPAASSPAPDADFPKFDAWAQSPDNEGKDYDDYTRALARHEWAQAQQQQEQQRTVQQRTSAYVERIKAANLDTSTLHPDVLALQPIDVLPPGAPVGPLNAVAQEIMLSEHAPALLRHFSEHPEELQALADAMPAVVFRTMGRLEALVSSRAPAIPASPVPAVSKAPPPPSTVGQVPSVPVDDAEAALARGDIGAYKSAMTRKDKARAGLLTR